MIIQDDICLDHNLLQKAVASTMVCTVIQICYLIASGASKKILAFFVYFIFEKNGFCKRRGGFNGVTILMWEFYWGTSKSQHFEWGVCRFFVIFNGVIFSYEIPVGWVIFLLGWKNGPFSEIFFTGVTSGVDPTGSQRQGCFLFWRIDKTAILKVKYLYR